MAFIDSFNRGDYMDIIHGRIRTTKKSVIDFYLDQRKWEWGVEVKHKKIEKGMGFR